MACRSSASGSTTSRLSRAWCCWVRCVLTFTTNDVEARIDRTRHPRRMNRPIARAGTRVLLFQSARRRRVPRYVHREIKEKDNQRDSPELNALQCQRRADVSGEGSRSESREFAKPIFAASSIPSLIRVVFCCFLGTAPAARRGIGRFRQPLCGLTRGLHSPPNSGGVQ